MLDSSNGNESDKPGVEEQYLTAAATSNLRVGNDSNIRTPGDMIAAAGMNRHRTGLALLRLRTEWDGAEKPEAPSAKSIEALAASLTREPAALRVLVPMTAEQIEQVKAELAVDPAKFKGQRWDAALSVPNPNAGLVRVEADGKVAYRLPLAVAKDKARAQHQNAMSDLVESMKGLSAVRDGLVHWLGKEDGVHVVAAVLLWWLDPWCPTCSGSGVRVVAGTGGRSSGKCSDCKGISANAGERRIPHGGLGKRVLSQINDCLKNAKVDLGQGAFRQVRTGKNDAMRLRT